MTPPAPKPPDPAHVHQDSVSAAPSPAAPAPKGQSLTLGVGLSGNTEAGAGLAGAGANMSIGVLGSSDGKSASLAFQATEGVTAYAGDKVVGASAATGPTCSSRYGAVVKLQPATNRLIEFLSAARHWRPELPEISGANGPVGGDINESQ